MTLPLSSVYAQSNQISSERNPNVTPTLIQAVLQFADHFVFSALLSLNSMPIVTLVLKLSMRTLNNVPSHFLKNGYPFF